MSENDLPSAETNIGQWPLGWYWKITGWRAIAIALVFGVAVFYHAPNWSLAVGKIIVFIGFGWLVWRARGGRSESLMVGALAGLILGFGSALGRLAHGVDVSALANLIYESLINAIIGAALVAGTVILSKIFNR